VSVFDFMVMSVRETVDEDDVRDNSLQLEEFADGEFGSMVAELASVFDDTEGIDLRPVPLVSYYAWIKSPLYRIAPSRTWRAKTAGQTAKVADLVDDLAWDAFMKATERRVSYQRRLLATVEVAPPLVPGGVRDLRLASYAAYEADVEFDDLGETDPSKARKIVLRVPVKREKGTITFGRRTYDRDHVWQEDGAGGLVGYYRPDGKNPFAPFLPFADVKTHAPRRGYFWPPIPTDLLAAQICTSIDLSDMGHVARFSSYPERTLIGEGAKLAAERMYTSPSRVSALTGSDLTYSVNNLNPALEKYALAVTTYLEYFERFHGLPAGALSKGITGAAKTAESLPQIEHREDSVERFRKFELALARLVVTTNRAVGVDGLDVDEDAISVDVRYNQIDLPDNRLQRSQSRVLDYATGAWSAEEEVLARGDAKTEEDAAEVVEARLESWAKLRGRMGSGVPGIDEIDKQVVSELNGGPSPPLEGGAAPAPVGDARRTLGDDEGKTLNGAQITAALDVVARVAAGALSADGALSFLVEGLGISEAAARKMIAGAKPVEAPDVASPNVDATT